MHPSLLQAEHPQLSQPFLVGLVFQSSDHLWPSSGLTPTCPCLSWAEGSRAGCRTPGGVSPEQSRVEGQNHLPRPAGHASSDAAQDTDGFLGCECTLVAHVQLFIHQYSEVLLHRAALNPFIPQPVLILGIAPTKMQDLHLALLNLVRFTWAHFLSLSRSLWMASCPSAMSTTPLSLMSADSLLKAHRTWCPKGKTHYLPSKA